MTCQELFTARTAVRNLSHAWDLEIGIVDHLEQPETPAILELILHEVLRTDLIDRA